MSGAGGKLKLYFDLMSQPSRAVVIFARVNKIPFQERQIALRKLEHLDDEFAKVNPFKRVPAMEDGDFKLLESGTIMRYLADKYLSSEQQFWYPKDIRLRSKVDEYLDWHHLNTRMNCAEYFRNRFLIPLIKQRPVDMKKLEFFRKAADKTLAEIQSYFLADRQFFLGSKVSVADLQACCEIAQLSGCGIDLASKHPELVQWMKRVREASSPHYDEATKWIYSTGTKMRHLVKEAKFDEGCSD
ncbi:glutathione S-transferase theta-1-like [Paramacrobiotus metropolitanus]|uniref:glutathione S-transferase theta-1-like n=1 Tax=Paramacrobiotus metropolitanus TaxID=2943436 RepID=UPI0024462619|nr:glutathione S-transferase theta-1-like [Paramacrobiotus metropolitanus]